MSIALRFMLVAAVAWVLPAGCAPAEDRHAPRLAVSIEPQRYLLERIAGDGWDVVSVLDRGEDPENYDPTVSDFRELSDSKVYFTIGTMPFEQVIASRLPDDVEVCDVSRHVTLLEGTHGHAGHHHEGHGCQHEHDVDPHIWASISNMKSMARTMCDRLVEVDPSNGDVYKANCRELIASLDSCDTAVRTELTGMMSSYFMVWHPSLSYFAADYGLRQLPMGSDNKEFSVVSFRRGIDRARNLGASLFLVQPDFDAGRSAAIASEAGMTEATVNTMVYDLPAELLRISALLKYADERNNE